MPIVNEAGGNATNKTIVGWDNLALTSTITASSEATPAINTIDPATYSYWSPSASPSWVRYDLGSAKSVDLVGIAAHDMATTATSIMVQYSSDGTTWADAMVSAYAPLTDEDIILTLPSVSARYWRIYCTGGLPSIGIVFLCARLEFPKLPVSGYIPLHHSRSYEKMFNDSIKGVGLGNRVMAAGAETEVDFGFVLRTFVDGQLRGFEDHYNQGGYFFYAGWPEGQVLDMGYCRAPTPDSTISVEYVMGVRWANLSFGIHSYVG